MNDVGTEMTLRDYASIVDRRKWVIVMSVLLTTLVALALSVSQTPIYSTSSEVLIQPRGQDGLFVDDGGFVDSYRAIETELQVIEGQAVSERVQQDLDLDTLPSGASASSIGDTDVISITVRDANATNAAILANAYAEAYIDVRREQSVNELLDAGTEVQRAIDDLQLQVDALDEDDPQRAALVAQLSNFTTTLDQLNVDARLRTGGATIIQVAGIPTEPIEPTPVRTATLAFVVGLLLGLAAAFLIDYLDDKVRDADDLEALTDRPVLAEVPVDPPTGNLPLAMTAPTHVSVEAYRGLRTNIQFLALDESIHVIQITSSLAGEGKTTTATNLAVVLARAGHRVALVDADLRRPRLHQVFDVPPTPGFTDIVLGTAPKDVVSVIKVGGGHKFSVYAAGTIPANPSEMLSGRRTRRILEQMGEHYDFVIVDSAPILPVSDSVALAGFADAVVVVAQAGRVTKHDVEETLERLDRVAAPVIGLVLNRAESAENDVYAYGGYAALATAPAAPGAAVDEDDDATGETIFSDA